MDSCLALTLYYNLGLHSFWLSVFLQQTHEALFLLVVLESTVTELGRSVDKLQCDLLQSFPAGLSEQTLSQSKHSLLGSRNASLQHHEIFVHFTVMRETTHRGDGLFSDVIFSGGVVLDHFVVFSVYSTSNTVDLLVSVHTMMISTLTSTWHSKADSGWMPGTNTGNFAKTFVRLSWKLLRSPSECYTSESLSFGYSNNIDHLILSEYRADGNGLLKILLGPVNFIGDGSSVDLQLHDMSLLLLQSNELLLGVNQHTNNFAVFLDLLKVTFDALLTILVSPFLGGLGESLLLGLVPILVESSQAFLTEMLGPNCNELSEATRSLNVSNDSNHYNWWCFQDGNSFNNFLLVIL